MSTEREPQFGIGKSVLYSAILIALVLTVAEGALRTWAYFFREQVARWDPGAQTFELIPGRHRTELGWVLVNDAGFVGAPLEPEAPELWRIVAMGDSCTFGAGNARHTYPAMLDRRLDAAERPGLRYEVVNGGISGLNSELVLNRLRSVVPPLEPDVITIYVGWNDLMKFDPMAQGRVNRWSGVARALDELWLARGMRKLIFFYVRPRLSEPATGPESDTGRFDDFVPGFYEENLRSLLAESREMGAEPLLMTLPTVVRPWMTVEDLRRSRVVFPYFRSAYGVGDFLDLVAAYNRTIRRVATEESVPLLDLARRFQTIRDSRPLFYDTMHTNAKGMEQIAVWLEEALRREGLLGRTATASRAAGR